ncbi:hypothetical protein ACNKHV_23610 [Shigella flexneri]
MLAFLNRIRSRPWTFRCEVRRDVGSNRSCDPSLVVFIGYLTMYLIRKNFNIAQNDMIRPTGLA